MKDYTLYKHLIYIYLQLLGVPLEISLQRLMLEPNADHLTVGGNTTSEVTEMSKVMKRGINSCGQGPFGTAKF